MNIKSASNSKFTFHCSEVINKTVCKCLGLYFDYKLSFRSHIDSVKMRLGKQCGFLSKLRHHAPRNQLLEYYRSNVVPIIQYGILIYRCCSYSSLECLFSLQKKILNFICFRKRSDSSLDIFLENKFLSVFEIHVHELLKFVLRAVITSLSQSFLNSLFSFEKKTRATRLSKTKRLAEPICKKKIDRFSVRYLATKLFNLLSAQKLIPENIERYSKTELVTFYHTFKTVFLMQNEELVDYIFKL